MHPEQTLENVDEALDLLAAIRSSIGYMLREIPVGSFAPLFELAQQASDAEKELRLPMPDAGRGEPEARPIDDEEA